VDGNGNLTINFAWPVKWDKYLEELKKANPPWLDPQPGDPGSATLGSSHLGRLLK